MSFTPSREPRSQRRRLSWAGAIGTGARLLTTSVVCACAPVDSAPTSTTAREVEASRICEAILATAKSEGDDAAKVAVDDALPFELARCDFHELVALATELAGVECARAALGVLGAAESRVPGESTDAERVIELRGRIEPMLLWRAPMGPEREQLEVVIVCPTFVDCCAPPRIELPGD